MRGGEGWEPNAETGGSGKPERSGRGASGIAFSSGADYHLSSSTASQADRRGKRRAPGGALGPRAKGDAELSGLCPGLSVNRLAPKLSVSTALNRPSQGLIATEQIGSQPTPRAEVESDFT